MNAFVNRWIDYWRNLIERSAFGVCQDIGERVGIRASKIRMYFIYTSFITFGSPLIIYLVMAFWMNIRRYITKAKGIIWD